VVQVPSLESALPSLNKQWSRIYYFDGSKPSTDAIRQTAYGSGEGKKVEYFSIGYGYWIYIPEVSNAQMVVLGDVVTDSSPKYHMTITNTGWNMLGYWGGNVYYTDLPSGISTILSDAKCNMVQISDIDYAFNSFKSSVDRVKATYKNTQCWFNPAPTDPDYALLKSITDLVCVGPGFGYFMHVTSPCDVVWP
jgi:hypothetical protein